MKIFLIRHGEQNYPYDEQGRKLISGPSAPLVELGRIQMRELRKKIEQESQTPEAFYRSPFLRAKQSAEELAGELSVPIYIVDELKEVEPNSAEGKPESEIAERGGDIYARPFNSNQEGLDHLVGRGKAAIEFILSDAKEHGYNSIAIVGHGDPLSALDWALKHEDPPSSYLEMRDAYYPQKGQAVEYIINSDLKIEGEGRIITTEAAKQTIEEFRNPTRPEQE